MNCFECTHELLLEPQKVSEQVALHLDECASCRELARELRVCEAMLVRTLQVPSPEHLDEKILRLYQNEVQNRSKRRLFNAVAAAFLGVTLFLSGYTYRTIFCPTGSTLVLSHAIEELGVLNIDKELSRERLIGELKDYGLSLVNPLGSARWIGRCEVPGGRGLHIVVDTDLYGILTIMVFPEQGVTNVGVVEGEGLAAWMIDIGKIQVGVATARLDLQDEINSFLSSALKDRSHDLTAVHAG